MANHTIDCDYCGKDMRGLSGVKGCSNVTEANVCSEFKPTPAETRVATIHIAQRVGDSIADMFEQLVKGGWVDDNLNPVELNQAMVDLKRSLIELGQFRAKHLGYDDLQL
jgi:hypothetical protein